MSTINQVLHEVNLQDYLAREKDQLFLEQKSRQESRYLSKVSRVLISLWELTGIILKSKPGDSLIIDCDSGQISRAKIQDNRVKNRVELSEKVPGRTSWELSQENYTDYLVSHDATMSGGNPMKHVWETRQIKAPKPHDNMVVDMFEEVLSRTPAEDISRHTFEDTARGFKYVEISIKDFPVTVGISLKTNRASYYIFEGNRVEI